MNGCCARRQRSRRARDAKCNESVARTAPGRTGSNQTPDEHRLLTGTHTGVIQPVQIHLTAYFVKWIALPTLHFALQAEVVPMWSPIYGMNLKEERGSFLTVCRTLASDECAKS